MYSLQYLYAPRFLFRAATRGAIDHPISANRQNVGRKTGWRVVKEKTMVRIYILRVSLAFAVILLAGKVQESRAEEGASVQESIAEAQAALRHRHYSQASRTLEDALKRFPGSVQLRLELGRFYVYQRRDARALEIFRAILRDDPSNREAKLELARVLSYGGKKKPAAPHFPERLATNPKEEAAATRGVGKRVFSKKKNKAARGV